MGRHDESIATLTTALAAAKRARDDVKANELSYRLDNLRTAAREARAIELAQQNANLLASANPEQLERVRVRAKETLAKMHPMDPRRFDAESMLLAVSQRQHELAATPTDAGPTPEQKAAARRTFDSLKRTNPLAAASFAEKSGPLLFDGDSGDAA